MVKLNIAEKNLWRYTCIDSNLYIIFSLCLYFFFKLPNCFFWLEILIHLKITEEEKWQIEKKLNKFLRIRGRKRKKNVEAGCWLWWIPELIFCYNLIHWKSVGEKNCILCSFINFAMKMQNYKSKLWHKSVGWSDFRGRRENWKFYLWIHGTRCDKLIPGSLLTSFLSSPAGDWGETRWIHTFPKDMWT